MCRRGGMAWGASFWRYWGIFVSNVSSDFRAGSVLL